MLLVLIKYQLRSDGKGEKVPVLSQRDCLLNSTMIYYLMVLQIVPHNSASNINDTIIKYRDQKPFPLDGMMEAYFAR